MPGAVPDVCLEGHAHVACAHVGCAGALGLGALFACSHVQEHGPNGARLAARAFPVCSHTPCCTSVPRRTTTLLQAPINYREELRVIGADDDDADWRKKKGSKRGGGGRARGRAALDG